MIESDFSVTWLPAGFADEGRIEQKRGLPMKIVPSNAAGGFGGIRGAPIFRMRTVNGHGSKRCCLRQDGFFMQSYDSGTQCLHFHYITYSHDCQ